MATVIYNKVKYYPRHNNSCKLIDELPSDKQIVVFASGAGYWIYYLGIAKFIQDHYELDDINFVGASAGTICCNALVNGIPMDDVMDVSLGHLECMNRHCIGVFGRWALNARQVSIDNLITHKTCLVNNRRLFSSVSQVTRYGLVKKYFVGGNSYECVVDANVASYWIPFITAPFWQPFLNINGNYYLDGFLSGNEKTKDKCLVIHPKIFGRLPLYTYWLWLDRDYNIRLYQLGYDNAKRGRQKLDAFLKLK